MALFSALMDETLTKVVLCMSPATDKGFPPDIFIFNLAHQSRIQPSAGLNSLPEIEQVADTLVRPGRSEREVLARHCRADDSAVVLPHFVRRQRDLRSAGSHLV